jgi:hypothetical protein
MNTRVRINLYADEFRPRRQWGTLPHLLLCWGSVLLLVLLSLGTVRYQLLAQQQISRQQTATLAVLQQRRDALIAEQARRQPDAQLQQQGNQLKKELAVKQLLLNSLAAHASLKSSSFADLLADLARIRSADVSLQRIRVNEGALDVIGQVGSSQSVPAWVNQFAATGSLKGKGFSQLEINRDANGQLTFHLSSPGSETGSSELAGPAGRGKKS